MFRASSAHLQEVTVVHIQHMVLSLSMRVRGGLSVHSLSENWLEGEGCWKGLWSFQIHLITVKEDHNDVQFREPVAQSRLKPTVYLIPISSVTYTSTCFLADAKLRRTEYKCSSLIYDVLYCPLLDE